MIYRLQSRYFILPHFIESGTKFSRIGHVVGVRECVHFDLLKDKMKNMCISAI